MKEFFIAITVVVTILHSSPSIASDKDGRFIHGGGVGAVECPAFVEARRQAISKSRETFEYYAAMGSFLMFIQGYRTAFNEKQPFTYDIFPDGGDESQLKWIEQWCGLFPDLSFADAVIALAQGWYPRRIQKLP